MSFVSQRVRDVLAVHGQLMDELSTMNDSDNLYAAGMTSYASVNVMLALENEFKVKFPDTSLRQSSFKSIDAIREILVKLGVNDTV